MDCLIGILVKLAKRIACIWDMNISPHINIFILIALLKFVFKNIFYCLNNLGIYFSKARIKLKT